MFNFVVLIGMKMIWSNAHTQYIIRFGVFILFTGLLLGVSQHYQKQKVCQQVNILMDSHPENLFLEERGVRRMLSVDHTIVGQTMGDLPLTSLEQALLETQFVDSVEAFSQTPTEIDIKIKLRKPIARIMNYDGQSFYIDEKGRYMPHSEYFTARTVLVRANFGALDNSQVLLAADSARIDSLSQDLFIHASYVASPRPLSPHQRAISDSAAYHHKSIQELIPMLTFVAQDSFWSAMVSEFVVNKHGDLLIHLSVGKLKIEFGSVMDYELKFKRLFQFFKEVLSKCGWEHYKSLSLRYRNQIVGTR